MTSKAKLQSIFDSFAKTAIKKDTDGYYLYGNSVNVTFFNDIWDVYLCNMKMFIQGDRTAYIGKRKLNNICATLPATINLHLLDGEAYFQTSDVIWLKGWLEGNRQALGIKKRKSAPPVHFGVRMGVNKTSYSV